MKSVERYWETQFLKIKDFGQSPVEEDELALIREWQRSGNSLPTAAARLVQMEGQYIDEQLRIEVPRRFQVIEVSYWYPWAPIWIIMTEEYLRGTPLVSLVNQGIHDDWAEYTVGGKLDNHREESFEHLAAQISAQFHTELASLTAILTQDKSGSGFTLIDHVLSAPIFTAEFRRTPYPSLIEQVARLGAERYKKYYLASQEK